MRRLLLAGAFLVLSAAVALLALMARSGRRSGSESVPAPSARTTAAHRAVDPAVSSRSDADAWDADGPRTDAEASQLRGGDHLAPAEWIRADVETVRLPPDAFPDLPGAVVAELQRLGCTIPQPYGAHTPDHNVIKGRFLSSANVDWAVLCSRDRVSSILIFPGGSVDSVLELESTPDANWLQVVNPGEIGFSRSIDVADPQHIVALAEAHGAPKPPPLDHDGVEHAFNEKASTILYWQDGQWIGFEGAD
jgi:hypothetical protein